MNGLARDANCSMAVEFFGNAFQEDDNDPMFETMVRGVKAKFDEDTLTIAWHKGSF